MTIKQVKTRNKPSAEALGLRKILKESFPTAGKVRVPQIAAFLGVGISTFWKYADDGRIKSPIKYGARVSVWDAEYIRDLADKGIPAKPVQAV